MKKLSSGFTLIELLIVIAIIGILAAGVLVLLDPVDKIVTANDSRVQNDVSAMGRASESYAALHGGFYEANGNELVTSGELKRLPVAPGGYMAYTFYTYDVLGNTPCAGGSTCVEVIIVGRLNSKKFVNASPPTPYWRYQTSDGRSCAVANALPGTYCP